ncbi:MAG: hypothetical protein Q9159_006667 [Coniocarpon cinnabarinum]
MNGLPSHDQFDASNSPPRARPYYTQSLNRGATRPSENFNSDPMYANDDLPSRYDQSRNYERMNSAMQNYGGYDMSMPAAWNSSGFGQNSNHLAALGATTRGKPPGAARRPIPNVSPADSGHRGISNNVEMWLDQPPPPMPGQTQYPGFGNSPLGFTPMRPNDLNAEGDDELIPTAIVIKNIPFAVKKEQLVQVMTEMSLPLPYAFNYHFDNGVFRGLAFANFTTPEETAAVIQGMNHLDLHGRKLRVEYKKMLPQAERDRIEREKRERRGQLEEQHRPLGAGLQSQPSMSSVSSRVQTQSPSLTPGNRPMPGLDMNDPTVLQYYSRLILFQSDHNGEEYLPFPPDLPSGHRTIIHGLAHSLGLHHESQGEGDQRRIVVYRRGAQGGLSDQTRRQLNRAATTNFDEARGVEPFLNGPASQSQGLLGGLSDTQGGLSLGTNLRAAKSFADLRSWTPSPAQSVGSFAPQLSGNTVPSRFQEYAPGSPGSSRSNITPTTATMPGNADGLLNGMNNMTLGGSTAGFHATSGSPHRLRGMMSWDRDGVTDRLPSVSNPGPIGGHRAYSATHDERGPHRSISLRQARGQPERGSMFPPRGRQNGHQARGSDEMSSQSNVEILVGPDHQH